MKNNFDNLTIQNDFLFKKVMENKRICKRLIEEILQIQIETLTFVEVEKTMDIYQSSKGIRMDVVAQDEKHTRYNIEMQAADVINLWTHESLLPKRTRYYQAVMDMDMLQKGQSYDELAATYIIFICGFDCFAQGEYVYTFRRTCQEDERVVLPDDTTILFLNAMGTHGDVTAHTKNFLQYVREHTVVDEFTGEIANEIMRIKNDKELRGEYMKYEMNLHDERMLGYQQGKEAGREEGREQGRAEGVKSSIIGMIREGMDFSLIAKITSYSIEQIQKIAQDNKLV